MERVIESDRVSAAEKIKGEGVKDIAIREKILAGNADDHPLVRSFADRREFNLKGI